MKLKTVAHLLTAGVMTLGAVSIAQAPSHAADVNFQCKVNVNTGLPTTYAVFPDNSHKPVVRWYSDYFSGSGYTPMRRCQEVSARFQNFYNSGRLDYITTGYINGQAVVCVASAHGRPCAGDTVLFTLKPGSNATSTIQRLFNISTGASDVLYESEDDLGPYIDFNQFLSSVQPEAVNSASDSPSSSPTSNTTEQPANQSGGSGGWR
ncbi:MULTISPECIES: COP23 domain-containing protein [Spirulina sp. CCY15215]|uniref:COP23 domain-containing protein n=1 Tax=Spirulina sp. CCY15215 TaxID=2767591 RepID=UPI00194E3553|nr:COP23 domain-containing protein [Spirulina major]